MSTSDYSFSALGVLISDMKFRIQINFIEATMAYVPRLCNYPAHELAAFGLGEVRRDHVIWTITRWT
jgi:hypothetical protein